MYQPISTAESLECPEFENNKYSLHWRKADLRKSETTDQPAQSSHSFWDRNTRREDNLIEQDALIYTFSMRASTVSAADIGGRELVGWSSRFEHVLRLRKGQWRQLSSSPPPCISLPSRQPSLPTSTPLPEYNLVCIQILEFFEKRDPILLQTKSLFQETRGTGCWRDCSTAESVDSRQSALLAKGVPCRQVPFHS